MQKLKFYRIVLVVLLVGIAGYSAYMYFTEWNEPTASYKESGSKQVAQLRQNIDSTKAELKAAGKYNCCIRNDCSWCAIYLGYCPCEKLVSRPGKEKSCPECAAAWNRKQGKVLGVDSEAIQVTTFGVYGFEEGIGVSPEVETKEKEAVAAENETGELQLSGTVKDGVRVVEVRARQFAFEPSTIVVREGEKIRLEVTSEDVTHGIGMPDLDIRRVLKPGKTEKIEFTPAETGKHHIHCTVYCGKGHSDMHGELIVRTAESGKSATDHIEHKHESTAH